MAAARMLMCTSYASCMARQQAKSLKIRNVSQEHVYSLVVHTTVFFLKCPRRVSFNFLAGYKIAIFGLPVEFCVQP